MIVSNPWTFSHHDTLSRQDDARHSRLRRVLITVTGAGTASRFPAMQQPFTVVRGEVVHPKREAAQHAWSSGLFDCTGDWCSCLSVWCCSSVTTAQLFTRCVVLVLTTDLPRS